MKAKTASIRVKLVQALLSGVGLASLCMLALCILMIAASVSRPFALFFFRHFVEFVILFLIIFSVLTILFFLLLTGRRIKYLEEITGILGRISEGDLEVSIPVKTNDELGKMADTVNNMVIKLRTTIEEEKRLEKTKNDLITNISHDLRTPLTAVLGYLELIAHGDCIDEAKIKKYGSIAYSQCKDLKVLIDDLFEFSKLNNPGIIISKQQINLRELIEQVLLGFIPALNEAEMEYRLSFPGERLVVDADPLLLTRVFDNLIGNAVKYGRDGRLLEVEAEKEGNEAVIKVINYGKTIPEEDIPYIFERFYRGDKSRSKQDGGTGLGLAIAKSIVGLHNGSIGVNSTNGRTIFEVRLITE